MSRGRAWESFIAGFGGTAYARRVATWRTVGPLRAVRFSGGETLDRAFDEFFVRGCAPADALTLVAEAQPLPKHYLTVFEDRPGLADAYAAGGYRLSHSEALMARPLDTTPPATAHAIHEIMVARTPDEADWLNARDPQGLRWIMSDNLADPHMAHYAIVCDGIVAARGRNTQIDAACGYVSRIYTADSYRRQGLAHALMLRLLADEAARGAEWSVLTASAMGAALYIGLGYRTLATIHIFEPAADLS